MRRLPLAFLRARLVAVFLISLAAVESSLLAWAPSRLSDPLLLVGQPLALALAAVFGALVFERLAGLLERAGRDRIRFVIGACYGTLLLLIGMGWISGSRDSIEAGGSIFRLLQLVALLTAGLGRGYLGCLVNAFILTVYAALAGGPAATAALALHGGLVLFFLVADFAARRFSEYPVQEIPRAWPLLREGTVWALVTGLGLLGFCHWVPPLPYEPLARSGAVPALPPSQVLDLLLHVLGACFIGAAAFWVALRWGLGSSRDAVSEDVERVASRSRAEPPRTPLSPLPPEGDSGWRGRIVRYYLDLLVRLARRGLRRPPSLTPREFALHLEPRASSEQLADLFGRARWGAEEPVEQDFEAARTAGEALLNPPRGGNPPGGTVV